MPFFEMKPATLHVGSLVLLAGGLIVALFIELRTRRIPNYLTLGMAVGGVLLSLIDGAWGQHLLGFLVGFVIGIALWIVAAAPGGAVKLLAAIVAVTSPQFIVLVVLFCFPIGFVFWLLLPQPKPPADSDKPPPRKDPYLHGSWVIAGSCAIVAGLFGLMRAWVL